MAFLSDLSSFSLRKLKQTQTKSVNWGEVFAQDKDYWMKRSDVHSITENLFLTSYMGASNLELLEKNGITHVLVAASKLEQKFPDKFSYKQINILDCPDQPIHHYFREVFEWIERAQTEKGRVLVHCNAGISRSATFVIGYLMYTKRYTYEDAFNWVSERRTCVSPNHGFIEHLKNFEKNNFAFVSTSSEVKEMKDCSPRHMKDTSSSSSSTSSSSSPSPASDSEPEALEIRTEVPIMSLPVKSEAAKTKRREAEL